MQDTEKPSNFDLELLQFLWDKWKHHDDLMYKRVTTFWVVQGLVLTGIIAIIADGDVSRISFSELPYRILSCPLCVCLLFIGGVLGLCIIEMMNADRNCRNAFNKKIVQILKERTNLFTENEGDWKKEDWKVNKDKHPINLWHTPFPFDKGKGVRASRIVRMIIIVIVSIEVLFVLIWVGDIICFNLGCHSIILLFVLIWVVISIILN